MTKLAERAYRLLKTVPRGRVTTYKLLSEALGTKAYRAVGQAMRKNPNAPVVPCHRVVRSDGSLGGFMGNKGGVEVQRKKSLLEKEGILFSGNIVAQFDQVKFSFT